MTFLSKPNPALSTRWMIEKGGKIFKMYVHGITSSGGGANFKVISYEVAYEHTPEHQVIEAEKFLKLIQDDIVKPDYYNGSLIHE